MRLFIAVNLDNETREYIGDKLNILKKGINEDLKWVNHENLHLTLKFLGEIKASEQPLIKEAINETTAKWQQGLVHFKGLAAFPHSGYPKTLFVEVVDGIMLLKGIYNTLERKLVNHGFKADARDYIPHLTIARSRRETNCKRVARELEKFTETDFINIKMRVEKISLMESKLFRNGPVYTEVHSSGLK